MYLVRMARTWSLRLSLPTPAHGGEDGLFLALGVVALLDRLPVRDAVRLEDVLLVHHPHLEELVGLCDPRRAAGRLGRPGVDQEGESHRRRAIGTRRVEVVGAELDRIHLSLGADD